MYEYYTEPYLFCIADLYLADSSATNSCIKPLR
jgi:hypothetical protein